MTGLLADQILQEIFGFETNVFVSRVWKINFNELAWKIWILCVKFFGDCYYLELKIEDRVLEKWKNEKKIAWYKK